MIFGFLRAFGLFLLRIPMIVLGIPVVWVALPYRTFSAITRPFTQFPQFGSWDLIRLPSWALWWDNPYDGMWGDKRGWWANYCNGEHTSRYNMWRWAALRNPANYFSRVICGVDVSTLSIQQVAGNISYEGKPPYRGFLLYRGATRDGRIYPRFYAEWAIKGTHGLMIDIGWKIKLSHNGTAPDAPEKDRLKGIVFTLSPWKELS